MPDINENRWLSLKEIWEYLGVKQQTILCWISDRNMPAVKAGKFWRFKIEDVDNWMRSGDAADEKNT